MTTDELKKTFNDWFPRVNGQPIEREDSSNLDQCFDLAFDWVDTLGIPRNSIRHERAYLIFTSPNSNTAQYFDIILNGANNSPITGDIVVFGLAVGVSGHVCIATGQGDANTFTSVDQNWDTPHFNHGIDPSTGVLIPYTRTVSHRYTANGVDVVLGWLRPKTNNITSPNPPTSNQITEQTSIPLGGDWGQPQLQSVRSTLNDQKRKIDDLQVSTDNLSKQLVSAQDMITKLKSTLNSSSPSLAVFSTSQLFGELIHRITGR